MRRRAESVSSRWPWWDVQSAPIRIHAINRAQKIPMGRQKSCGPSPCLANQRTDLHPGALSGLPPQKLNRREHPCEMTSGLRAVLTPAPALFQPAPNPPT